MSGGNGMTMTELRFFRDLLYFESKAEADPEWAVAFLEVCSALPATTVLTY